MFRLPLNFNRLALRGLPISILGISKSFQFNLLLDGQEGDGQDQFRKQHGRAGFFARSRASKGDVLSIVSIIR